MLTIEKIEEEFDKEFIGFNDRGIVHYVEDNYIVKGLKTPTLHASCLNCGLKFIGEEAKKMMFGHVGCKNPNGKYDKKNKSFNDIKLFYRQQILTLLKEIEGELPKKLGFEDYDEHIHTYTFENRGKCKICGLSWNKAGQYEFYNTAISEVEEKIKEVIKGLK